MSQEIIISREPNIPFMGRYIEKRMPRAFKASAIGRNLPTDADRCLHIGRLKTAASTLVADLGIDPMVFRDRIHREFFLALCDGLVGNEDQETRDFLYTGARVLVGPYSEVNIQEASDGVEGADRYVVLRDSQEEETYKKTYEAIMGHFTERPSKVIKRILSGNSPKGILNSLREQLGIIPETEASFDVRVLDVGTTRLLDPITGRYQDSEWKTLTSPVAGSSQAFVWRYPNWKNNIVYFPVDIFDDIDRGKFYTLEHEYFHTQRSLRFGAGAQLGKTFDEGAASWMAQSPTYPEEQTVLQVLDGLTGGEFFPKLVGSLRRKRPQEVYKFISDNFGFWSLLLLSADQPDNYDAIHKCFDSIPGLSSEYRLERSINRTTILCRERVKLDPGAIKYLDNLSETLDNPKTVEGGVVQRESLVKWQIA